MFVRELCVPWMRYGYVWWVVRAVPTETNASHRTAASSRSYVCSSTYPCARVHSCRAHIRDCRIKCTEGGLRVCNAEHEKKNTPSCPRRSARKQRTNANVPFANSMRSFTSVKKSQKIFWICLRIDLSHIRAIPSPWLLGVGDM